MIIYTMKTLFLSQDNCSVIEEWFDETDPLDNLKNIQNQQLKEYKRKDDKALLMIQQEVSKTMYFQEFSKLIMQMSHVIFFNEISKKLKS